MNHWCGTGNVSNNIQMRYTTNGKAVANFDVAINSRQKDTPAVFLKITVWEKLAEACAKNILKGDKIVIEGKIKSHTYQSVKYPELRITDHYIEAYSIEFDPRNVSKKNSGKTDSLDNENVSTNEFIPETEAARQNYEEDIPF